MPVISPSYLMDLESRMRFIQETEYLELTSKLWWDKCTKIIPSGSKRELVSWIINSAQLEDQGLGGNMTFDDMSIVETEFKPKDAGKGLKLRKNTFEDLDGNGVEVATEWSKQIGAQFAYWGQKQISTFLMNGAQSTSLAYDGLPYFSASHLVHPLDSTKGTYSNLITGKPIDASVTTDVALANLQSVFASIASIKAPNGSDPRNLEPAFILAPPKLFPRAVQLTNAKFIAQAAATGGGGADVEALIASMGFGMPVQANELAGWESDTSFFVFCKAATTTTLGGLVYVDREPFHVTYYTGEGGATGLDAILSRTKELEWHAAGRNVAGYGHPYAVIKVTA